MQRVLKDSLRRLFTNVKPEQIADIPWGWENTVTEAGTFVSKPTGEIRRIDLRDYFNWYSFAVEGFWNYGRFGTQNMKSIFQTAVRFLGYEELLTEQPPLTPITDMFCEWNTKLLEAFPFERPFTFLIGDDYGWNTGLFMHPQTWWRWIKPELQRLVNVGRDLGGNVVLHSDGDIYEIVNDLAGMGFSGLEYQPVGHMEALQRLTSYAGLVLWQVPA